MYTVNNRDLLKEDQYCYRMFQLDITARIIPGEVTSNINILKMVKFKGEMIA